jgi:1,4-alpha-glucan branching enzyme
MDNKVTEPENTVMETQPDNNSQMHSIAGVSRFTEYDIYLFREGKHYHLYNKLGAHIMEHEGVMGTYFAVWAPNAEKVTVW